MKKMLSKISKFFGKFPVITYTLKSMAITFLISAVIVAVAFLILWLTGVYAKLKMRLDLKYSSSWFVIPMWVFAALFVVSILVGFLLYFHKYKRGKPKTPFYKALAQAYNKG